MKLFSLILCFSVPGSGFFALCPGGDGHTPEVHLITEVCEKHTCNRTEAPPPDTSPDHNRHHETCSDRPIIDEYVTVQQDHLFILSAALPVVVRDLFHTNYLTAVLQPAQTVYAFSAQRTPVLRI